MTEQIQEFFVRGEGKKILFDLLESPNQYLQLRCLWALSNMPLEGKAELITIVFSQLIKLLASFNPDIQGRAARVFANFASVGKYNEHFDVLFFGDISQLLT